MDKANEPIHPCIMQQVGENEFRLRRDGDPKEYQRPMVGLTKREYFAAMAMTNFTEHIYSGVPVEEITSTAVLMADALINALNQPLK